MSLQNIWSFIDFNKQAIFYMKCHSNRFLNGTQVEL